MHRSNSSKSVFPRSNIFKEMKSSFMNRRPLDDYQVLGFIASGRYGVTSRVYSSRYQREFCMKVVQKNAPCPALNSMFVQETKALSNICHPNVVQIYDYYETEDTYNIVMENCQNGTLQHLLDREGTLSLQQIRLIFRPIVESIAFCHNLGIAHRDLKPSNIAMDLNNRPKIIDWGFSISSVDNEMAQTYCGTFPYAAPECLRKVPYDPKMSDMWSIGVLLYVAAFGIHPFAAQHDNVEITKAIHGEYSIPQTDTLFRALLSSLLQIDPAMRLPANHVLNHPFFQVENDLCTFANLPNRRHTRSSHIFSNGLFHQTPHKKAAFYKIRRRTLPNGHMTLPN